MLPPDCVISACKPNPNKNSSIWKSRELVSHWSLYIPTPGYDSLYLWNEAIYTISNYSMTILDRPLYPPLPMKNERISSPLTNAIKPKLIADNTALRMFSAIMAEENSTIGSSECSWPHIVQYSSSVLVTANISIVSQSGLFVQLLGQREQK